MPFAADLQPLLDLRKADAVDVAEVTPEVVTPPELVIPADLTGGFVDLTEGLETWPVGQREIPGH